MALMVASLVGGFALWLIRLPNCWFLGSIVAVAIIGALGLVQGRVPDVILVLAQVIIGVSIGTQYRHEFLTRLLRLLLASLVTVPFALLATGVVPSSMRCCSRCRSRPRSWRWPPPALPRWR